MNCDRVDEIQAGANVDELESDVGMKRGRRAATRLTLQLITESNTRVDQNQLKLKHRQAQLIEAELVERRVERVQRMKQQVGLVDGARVDARLFHELVRPRCHDLVGNLECRPLFGRHGHVAQFRSACSFRRIRRYQQQQEIKFYYQNSCCGSP